MCAKIRYLVAVLFVAVAWASDFVPQSFRVMPQNQRVKEGTDVVFECSIDNLDGNVRWSINNFIIGRKSPINGYPRIFLMEDKLQGTYKLKVVNVTVEEEGVYECQIGPDRNESSLNASATLTVIAPPKSLVIQPSKLKTQTFGDPILEVAEFNLVELECRVEHAKPAARITWYKNNSKLKKEAVLPDVIEEVVIPNLQSVVKMYNTISKISLKAYRSDDYADITCEARHEALRRDKPMRSTVQLSIHYPPSAPIIVGYTEGEIVRIGQPLKLECKCLAANPPAQLIWYKNDNQISATYKTKARTSENVLSFTANASDNKARYRCEAFNVLLMHPVTTEIDLTVLYAPTHVTISGPSEARVGDSVPLSCSTDPSNPAAEIKWLVDGKHYKEASTRTIISPKGGWITTSYITVAVKDAKTSSDVQCYGSNQKLSEIVVSSYTINVLYPPNPPLITGYVEGTTLVAGTVHRLSCMSAGGNPLATLTWYKNAKKINSYTETQNNSVISEISILTNVTDNQAKFSCEATNTATETPFVETVTLIVYFAPEMVKVRAEPKELKTGLEATLYCEAASSNPPAVLSWWRNGIPVQGQPMQQKKGLNGGTVSTTELKLNISKDLNGVVYTCQATNEALESSVNDALALKVLYAPIFDEATPYTTVGVENEPLIIVIQADGNPDSMSYTWTKDGLPITRSSSVSSSNDRIISEGNILNMTKLSRHDAGIYTCEAVNSQGAAVANITVNVHYPALIKSVFQDGISNPKEDAMLTCTAVGNPLNADHIRWERKGYTIERDQVSFDNMSTSYLLIREPTRADVGIFQCVVDNGIGGENRQDVMLVVKFKPEMDPAPNLAKAASNVGQVAKLTCRCKSAPAPNFTWSKNGAKLPVNTSTKYFAELVKSDAVTYTSVLLIINVTTSDFGTYECGSRNDLGFSTTSVKLDITSAPDQIISLTVTNVTQNSVSLEWTPGFDGGLYTWFRVRYRKIYDDPYKYQDVPNNGTTYTIGGLDRNTGYVFSVMGINKMGEGKYRPDDIKATTLSNLPTSVQSDSTEINSFSIPRVFIMTGAIGTAFILMNVLLIGFFLFRRTKNRNRASSEVGELNIVATEYVESADVMKLVIVYVSVTAAVLILINAGLVACFVLKRRTRRLKGQAGQSPKLANIEMYARRSYNDTMAGDSLSSVSEKSETYSQDGDDLPPHPFPGIPIIPNSPQNMMSQTTDFQITEQVILPSPLEYTPTNYCEEHARTLPHPHRHKEVNQHGTLGRSAGKSNYVPSPMPPLDGSYNNMASDRYLSYPPLIDEYLQRGSRTPTPPQQCAVPYPKSLMHGRIPSGLPSNMPIPPHNYGLDISFDRQSAGGTLRNQRMEKMAVPPPDVTVLHPGTCTQHSQTPKQPQSILKDPSRHKYGNQYGSPISTSTPSNSSQILTVQNLTSEIPQYGTIRKEKKQNVTIDESFIKRNETLDV